MDGIGTKACQIILLRRKIAIGFRRRGRAVRQRYGQGSSCLIEPMHPERRSRNAGGRILSTIELVDDRNILPGAVLISGRSIVCLLIGCIGIGWLQQDGIMFINTPSEIQQYIMLELVGDRRLRLVIVGLGSRTQDSRVALRNDCGFGICVLITTIQCNVRSEIIGVIEAARFCLIVPRLIRVAGRQVAGRTGRSTPAPASPTPTALETGGALGKSVQIIVINISQYGHLLGVIEAESP